MKKLLAIALIIILGVAECNAQYEDASWLHNELWQKVENDSVWGRIYSTKIYFTENGEFYYGSELHKEAKAFSDSLIRSYSGTYDYNPTEEEISLHVTEINGIETLTDPLPFGVDTGSINGAEINFREKGRQWTMLHEKWNCTFAMYANPIIFKIKTMNIDCSYPEDGRLDLKDELNVEASDQRKILDVLRHAKYSRPVEDLDEWIEKADAIITMAEGEEEFARVFIKKGEPSICIDAYGCLTVTTLQYEVDEISLKEIEEIAKKYMHNQN